MKITTFRKTFQGIFFALFVLLFLFTVYPFGEKLPVDLFLRLDPLVALISMIASRAILVTMLWSLLLILATLLLGRFFCGYVCPLGTLIDSANYLFFKKHGKPESPIAKPNRNYKYFFLIGVIAASIAGVNLCHYFSPLSITPRFFTLALFPPLVMFLNFLLDLFRPVSSAIGLDALAHHSFHAARFWGVVPILALMGFILIANYWRKRFWCRYVCPTGALLSLFSRFGMLKRQASSPLCNTCRDCITACDMHAIDTDPSQTILSECTLCGNCVDACAGRGVAIALSPFGFAGQNAGLHVDRRRFIYAAAAGVLGASSIKAGLQTNDDNNGRFIRPPGAVPEKDFLARCIRCGECMKVCKTNGLQPATINYGLEALWTPRLIPRQGPCEDKCTMCGHVCPTQAIRALPLEEKLFVKIGTAVIDRHRCIAWEQDKLCLICDEICPYDAIEFRIVDNFTGPFKRPFVLEDKCVGCGWCERKCPIHGRAAIEIYSFGEERFMKGSYITRQKKEMREIKDSHESDYDADALGSGGTTGAQRDPMAPQNKQEQAEPGEEKLPGGFILD